MVVVIDISTDKVVKRLTVGTGGKEIVAGIGGATVEGLAADPFWWFEK